MSEIPKQDFVVVGRISKPFGLEGWSHITSFTEPPSNLMQYRPWALGSDTDSTDHWEIVGSLEMRALASSFIARIGDCETRNSAHGLTGRLIGVPKGSLPTLAGSEFYWVDLVGCSIVNESGLCLGTVLDVFENGAHPILNVHSDKRQHLIPFVSSVIKCVKPGSEIRVAWETDW